MRHHGGSRLAAAAERGRAGAAAGAVRRRLRGGSAHRGRRTALLRTLADKTGLSGAVFTPLWKVLAIALTVRVGGAFCRDAAQGALASVLETAGAVCALTAAAPLLLAVAELVEGWL